MQNSLGRGSIHAERALFAHSGCRLTMTLGHKPNVTGFIGTTAWQKHVGIFHVLTYGVPSDTLDEVVH